LEFSYLKSPYISEYTFVQYGIPEENKELELVLKKSIFRIFEILSTKE